MADKRAEAYHLIDQLADSGKLPDIISVLGQFRKDTQLVADIVNVTTNCPGAFHNFCAEAPWPKAAEEAYISEIDRRWELFVVLRQRLTTHHMFLTSSALAIFMVAPLGVLEDRVNAIEDAANAAAIIGDLSDGVEIGIKTFLAKAPRAGSSRMSTASTPAGGSPTPQSTFSAVPLLQTRSTAVPSPLKRKASTNNAGSPRPTKSHSCTVSGSSDIAVPSVQSSPLRRSRVAVKAAKERDENKCCLSEVPDPDAAHIFSFSGTSEKSRDQLARLLCFWGEEKYRAWEALYSDESITESAQNILCLNKQLHSWWGSARFALKPLPPKPESDKNEISLAFYWLPTSEYRLSNPPILRDEAIHRLGAGSNGSNWGPALLSHHKGGLPIESGHIFTIRARNPADLPNRELLELQWHLLRVAAMCGAADAYDEPGDRRWEAYKEFAADFAVNGHLLLPDSSEDSSQEQDKSEHNEDVESYSLDDDAFI